MTSPVLLMHLGVKYWHFYFYAHPAAIQAYFQLKKYFNYLIYVFCGIFQKDCQK